MAALSCFARLSSFLFWVKLRFVMAFAMPRGDFGDWDAERGDWDAERDLGDRDAERDDCALGYHPLFDIGLPALLIYYRPLFFSRSLVMPNPM
jgi:hypothetical protein